MPKLRSSSSTDGFADKFLDAANQWQLERLYTDLTAIKQLHFPHRRAKLTPLEKACLRGFLCQKSPSDIANILNREPKGLRVDLSRSLYRYLESLTNQPIKDWSHIPIQLANYRQGEHKIVNTPKIEQNQVSWGEAIDVSVFYGRSQEITLLTQWIIQDHCRLVAILGMGGMGKTTLSVKLAQNLESHFDFVFWRSLRSAPDLSALLKEIVSFLSQQQEINGNLFDILHYLKSSRCLIILDNWETLLDPHHGGQFLAKYQDYSELLEKIGTISHQSCLLITSREKPAIFASLEGLELTNRSLFLTGIGEQGEALLKNQGLFGSQSAQKQLIQAYSGNPLALKIVSTSIQDLFDGEIEAFLREETFIFHGIRRLLQQQFNRLSPLEKNIMRWLAINRDWTSIKELQEDIIPPVTKSKLLEALETLSWRSLIEKRGGSYTQQPVVMEYITDTLIEQLTNEILQNQPNLINQYSLLKTEIKEYLKETQIRLIITPLLDRLSSHLYSKENIQTSIKNLLELTKSDHNQYSHLREGYITGNLINLLHQINANLTGYDFSGLTIRQADLRNLNLANVNFQKVHFIKSSFTQQLFPVLALAFSKNGQYIASGESNGCLRVWKTEQDQLICTSQHHQGHIVSLCFIENDSKLISGGLDGLLRVTSAQTGELLHTFSGHQGQIWSIDCALLQNLLASGSGDHTIRIWNLKTKKIIYILEDSSEVWTIKFNYLGNLLVSGSAEGKIKLWDVQTGELLDTLIGHEDQVRMVDVSRDGKQVISASSDRTLKLWDIEKKKLIHTFEGHNNQVWTVAFNSDGNLLASGDVEGKIKLWDVNSKKLQKTIQGHREQIHIVTFHPKLPILASSGFDSTFKFWGIPEAYLLKIWQGFSPTLFCSSWHPQGHQIVAGGGTQIINRWNIEQERPFMSLEGHEGWIFGISFNPDGKGFASASTDSTIKVWDTETGKCYKTLYGHDNWTWTVDFHPKKPILASGSSDRTIKLWNLTQGKVQLTLKGHENAVSSVQFSPDGLFLASASFDRTIKLWNAQTGQQLNSLQGHDNWIYCVKFSRDGQILASSDTDGKIIVWSLKKAQIQHILTVPPFPILTIDISPDAKTLASCQGDLILWDLKTGKQKEKIENPPYYFSLPKFSPDGQLLSTCATTLQGQVSVQLWHLETRTMIKELKAPLLYENMNIAQTTGITKAQKTALWQLGAI
ncbi:NB-ARC domain-containing protein [Gloeothece verrucosa]|uniref:WD40 repeat, subgroup n=1 Tax=Gloeothece verrucosa (strain PCC 7822) TaxID=497965 RepID=E0UN54_GLOV7|nr:NB-ARC domain-containing protein [Gloeothece verrucosa]ADN18384.1 WD40 repeat, subgroup [Gloeothece verrucosa PCC 7822]